MLSTPQRKVIKRWSKCPVASFYFLFVQHLKTDSIYNKASEYPWCLSDTESDISVCVFLQRDSKVFWFLYFLVPKLDLKCTDQCKVHHYTHTLQFISLTHDDFFPFASRKILKGNSMMTILFIKIVLLAWVDTCLDLKY